MNLKQKQKKKTISIVISTSSHFWSSDQTTYWCVFVSLLSMVYTPTPNAQLFFLWGENFVFVPCSSELGKFQISSGRSVLGGTNIRLREGD